MPRSDLANIEVVNGIADALCSLMERYRLYCGKCWTEGRFDPKHLAGSKDRLRRAAEHFVEQGWTFATTPRCPVCSRRDREA